MSSISIRSATPADVPLILSLIRELAEYEREPDAVVATEGQLRDHLFGASPYAQCVMGEIDGVVQGFALYFHNFSTWRGRPGLYLEDLFVRPSARGVGLGRALFTHLARVAVERGCARMEWAVLDWNEPAMGFYRRMGAVALSEWTVWRLTDEALVRAANAGFGGKG